MTPNEPVPLPGDARGWIPALQRAGYSANGALEFLKAQGAGIRRQTFLRTWGEIAADLASRPALAEIPLDTPLAASQLRTWRAGRAGTFGYEIAVTLRDRASGLVTVKTHYVFSPSNIAPAEAVDQGIADYVEAQTAGGPSGVLTAAYFVQGYTMLGRSAA